MALIVEDGTGRADAESYISAVDASAYHSNRGNAAWAAVANDLTREQFLRKAVDYMQQAFRLRWAGSRTTIAQALDWPRAWVPVVDQPSPYRSSPNYFAQNVIPVEVSRACAELALMAVSGDLNPILTRGKLEVTVGPITTKYDPASPEFKRFRSVEQLLSPYLLGSDMTVKLSRT